MPRFIFAGFFYALLASTDASAQTARDASACPKIVIPSDATVIGIQLTAGAALANIYLEDPNNLLGVVDVEIEPGDGKIFVVGISSSALVWRFTGATRRVAGGLFIGNRSATFSTPTSSAVVGLAERIVTIAPPKTCPLRAVSKSAANYGEHQQTLREMSGREMDQIVEPKVGNVAKLELPSGRVVAMGAKLPYRYPGKIRLDLAPEAAKVLASFLRHFGGGLVHIDPGRVVSLRPAKNFERLPGLLGLAELVSDGTLELTGMPDDFPGWWSGVNENWADLGSPSDLSRSAIIAAKNEQQRKWWSTGFANWPIYGPVYLPSQTLDGNGFRLDGNTATIEDANGNWVPLETVEFIIRGPFTVPPATPSQTHLPMFLLPVGVPEPVGPFRRELPLLREVVD